MQISSLKKQDGQALIELAIVTPILILAILLLLNTFLAGSVYFYSRYLLHEMLVCVAENNSTDLCKQKITFFNSKAKIKWMKSDTKIKQTENEIEGEQKIILPMRIQFQINQKLKLPIIDNI